VVDEALQGRMAGLVDDVGELSDLTGLERADGAGQPLGQPDAAHDQPPGQPEVRSTV
jgi:hypothetical protein